MATTDPANIAPETVVASTAPAPAAPTETPAAGAVPGGAPETEPSAEPPVAKYAVLSPLMHDGKVFGVGDTVSISPAQASGLLAAGVIKKAK